MLGRGGLKLARCNVALQLVLLLLLLLRDGVYIARTILNVLQHLQRLCDHVLVLELLYAAAAEFAATYRLNVLGL